jgi:hypothetical protein
VPTDLTVRLIPRRRSSLPCRGAPTRLVAFSTDRTDRAVEVTIDGETYSLSPVVARELADGIADALRESRSFVHTRFERRGDGSVVVARRRASSSGNEVVFESPDDLRTTFDALPDRFGADDVTRVSGSRRHLLVRFFAESPAFDCTLVSENPLRAAKGET